MPANGPLVGFRRSALQRFAQPVAETLGYQTVRSLRLPSLLAARARWTYRDSLRSQRVHRLLPRDAAWVPWSAVYPLLTETNQPYRRASTVARSAARDSIASSPAVP